MARRARLVNAFTKGVLDPRLADRIDLQHYYTGLAEGRNILIRPQGGFRRRPGTLRKAARLRRRLEPVAFTALMVTAHNGGTAASLVDENEATAFTTSAVGAPVFVLAEIDLSAEVTLTFADVLGFSAASAGADDCLAVEYWDGATWASVPGADLDGLSPRRNIRTSARSRRFGGKPGFTFTTRYVRVVAYNAIGAGAISIAGLRLWKEAARLSPTAFLDFARDAAAVYQAVLSDRNIDLFDAGVYIGSVPVDLPLADLDEVNAEQSRDTLLLFHDDLRTLAVQRQGAPDEWNVEPVAWTNIPDLDIGLSFSGAQDEIQDIAFTGYAPGQTVALFMGRQIAVPFTAPASGDLPAAVAAAIGALPGVTAAGVAASLVSLMPVTVRVTFSGANAARRWPRIEARLLGTSHDCTTTRVQAGLKTASAKIYSSETGWPRAGAFHQSRLITGGAAAAPNTFLMSVVGEPYNLQLPGDPALADRAIQYTIDSDQIETIREIYVGRHLQIFTDSGEWWVENRNYDATAALNVILATRHGVATGVPLAFADNATMFIQAADADAGETGSTILRDFLYSDAAANYEAEPLSLLGPHLLTDVVSMAVKKARNVGEGNVIFLVNADGSFALLTLLRSQEVIAITQGTTAWGQWRDVACDFNGRVWIIAERGGDNVLELWTEGQLFDSAVTYVGSPITRMTGLDHLDGQAVWAVADNDIVGPFTVDGGGFDLPAAASAVTSGLPFYAYVKSLHLREKLQEGQPFRLPARVYEIELGLIETGDVKVRANGDAGDGWRSLPLRHWDGAPPVADRLGTEPANDALDVPLMERLYTGAVTVDDLKGWSKHPVIEIGQDLPAPLEVRSNRYEVAF